MKRVCMAMITAALLLQLHPAAADDPPAKADDAGYGSGTATETKDAATDTIQVEEIPNGAASMEPAQKESPEERSERAFVENIWNSP